MNRFFLLSLLLALAFLLAGCTPAATTDGADGSASAGASLSDLTQEAGGSREYYTGVLTARFTEGAGEDQAEVLALETEDGTIQCTLLADSRGDLSAAVGDRVTAECQMVEGAPGYHPVLTLTVLKQAAATEVETAACTTAYNTAVLSLGVALPDGWSWEMLDEADNPGIAFWRSDAPELEVTLALYPAGIGMCGTGVAIEDVTLPGGLTATTYTEEIQGATWFTLVYQDVDGLPEGAALAACYNGSATLWGKWGEDVFAILSTVQYQEDFLPWGDALEVAKSDFALVNGYTPEDWNGTFDPNTGDWTITFYREDADGNLAVLDTVTVTSDHTGAAIQAE
ncbi:MAG: hypothetical protein LUD82_05140 [Clostridiales bacterium]|nr:hypothetical protein [Clostridiales bacterium]